MHGAHALRTAELLGLIAENGDDITPVGRAVMQSKSLKKTDLVKADAALMALLKHIDELNQNPDRLFTITQVYLYGSVMRRAAEVGDIDLEIRTDRGPRYARGTNFQLYLDACLACVRSFNPNYYDDGMTREIDSSSAPSASPARASRSAWPTLPIISSTSPGSRGEVPPHSAKTGR